MVLILLSLGVQGNMKTVSLELAKTLKEQGFPQEKEEFYFYENNVLGKDKGLRHRSQIPVIRKDNRLVDSGVIKFFAAPSADEMLETLPLVLDNHCYLKIFRQTHGKDTVNYWHIAYNEDRHTCGKPSQMAWQFEESLADVAAKMWLLLKKDGLLESAE